MKKQIWISGLLLVGLVIGLIGCGEETVEEENTSPVVDKTVPFEQTATTDGDYAAISRLRPQFGDDMEFEDKEVALEFLAEADRFVAKYPNDRRAPVTLLQAAGVCKYLDEWYRSLEYFERVWTDYPTSNAAPQALFLQAFVYDEKFLEKEKALEYYQKYLEMYPDDDFVNSAELLINNIKSEMAQ